MSDAAIRGQDSRVWVLLESGSNQDFIFQSTRRRFQVGASALLKDMPVWVDEGLRAVTGQAPSYVDEGIDRGPGVVRVVATSSKALLLAEDPEQGKALVAAVTAVALERAPGLDVWGYVEDVESALLAPPIDRLGDVHAAHANLRWTRPTPKQRFPLHPFLESCPVTGLPAATLDRDPAEQDGKLRPVSEPAAVVLARANAEVKRLTDVYGSAVLQDLTEDVRNAGWVAVVHADGNSVGELIPNLVSVNELAQFSRELERATAGRL
ncbi:MAG: hypothetical protein HZY73_12200 [Micropruina sp.]|nr:MAG: hypothetical protein HZY73_12200 [Micropruina sp.]